MLLTRSQNEQGRMVITTSQCYELRNSGQTTLSEKSTRWTLQSVWRSSNLPGSWKLEAMTIIFWTRLHTWQLPENSQSRIGTIWMLSRSPRGAWCDYCKQRWSTSDYRGQTQAVWQITSKRHGKIIVRHYCHSCAMDVQSWNGSTWTIQEQINYAKGIQNLDVQFE